MRGTKGPEPKALSDGWDSEQLSKCKAPPAGLYRALARTTSLRFLSCLAWTARCPRPLSVAIETGERWACEL